MRKGLLGKHRLIMRTDYPGARTNIYKRILTLRLQTGACFPTCMQMMYELVRQKAIKQCKRIVTQGTCEGITNKEIQCVYLVISNEDCRMDQLISLSNKSNLTRMYLMARGFGGGTASVTHHEAFVRCLEIAGSMIGAEV